MDVDRQLQELKKVADDSILQSKKWHLVVSGLVATCILLIVFTVWIKPTSFFDQSTDHPGQSSVSAEWGLSQKHTDSVEGNSFTYQGEKPVRIITTDLYEDQGQKTIWLLDGQVKAGESVQIVGTKESGEQAKLGSWTVGDPLYDAAGHFPSSIALPSPGVWKLEVLTPNGALGSVTVQVNAGVAPYSKWLEGLVINYIQSDQQFAWIGQPRFVSIDMFGVYGPSADQKYVYAWVLVESYKKEKDSLVQESGWSFPAKFVVDYVNGDYRVTKMEYPDDGNEYWSSIERIFPTKYLNPIKEKTGNVTELQKQIEKQAHDYFSGKEQ